LDLRERIVAAYENNEGSHSALAARFSVSKVDVGKLVRQQRERGTLQPQVHLRGRKPAIVGEKLEQLRQHLIDYPDATLAERIEALELDCCVNTMWLTIRRLGCRYKKTSRAAEQDRPDVARRRVDWRERLPIRGAFFIGRNGMSAPGRRTCCDNPGQTRFSPLITPRVSGSKHLG